MEERITRLAETLFKAATLPLAVLPDGPAHKFGAAAAVFGARLWASRRRFAAHNIRKALEHGAIHLNEQPEALAKKSFAHLGRCAIELVKIYHGRSWPMIENVEVTGLENYQRAKAKGKGILVVTGHCGNWEMMGLAFARKVEQGFVVARPLNSRSANLILEKIRTSTGNGVIYKEGAIRRILTELRKNRSVGILMDQAVLPEEGCVVEFLGRDALTTRITALLARKTGAPVVPIFLHRKEDGGHAMTIYPEVPLSDLTDKEEALQKDTRNFSSYIEAFIARHPEQWLWGHRRWKRAAEEFPF